MKLPENFNSVCFTGHRSLSSSEVDMITGRIRRLISVLISRGLTDVYTGGALGMDTVAALSVLKAKEDHPQLKLNLIIPCQCQENAWNDMQKSTYNYIKSKADSVRILAPFFYNGCMQVRNREMLDHSDICIAYLRPGTQSGGSLNTVITATKLGIPIINLANTESEDLI